MSKSATVMNAVVNADALALGMSASVSLSMVFNSQAESTGLLMLNAVNNQSQMQQITNAAVAQTLSQIVAAGLSQP